MTLIKQPFKKKRASVGADGKRSPSMTPRSTRGSKSRSISLGSSSVNSYEESEHVVECNINASTKNIYADIDDDKFDVATNNSAMCDEMPPKLPAANSTKFKVLQVPMINECEHFDEFVDDLLSIPGIENKLNCSKNNLLLIDDHLMTTSIDNHLNNIELINRNLDKLMETHRAIDNDEHDDETCLEVKAEKKKLKAKVVEKIKILREVRMMSPGTSDGAMKESFKSRVKNIFPKFERQASHESDEKIKEKFKSSKGFLSSFKKKSNSIPDETNEEFEEIKKVSSEVQLTDLDEKSKSGEKFSTKFKHKLKLNIKSIGSKMSKQKTPPTGTQICRRCSKTYEISGTGNRIYHNKAVLDFTKEFHTEKLFDYKFCVCVDVDDVFDDGICIKNLEYKDVSSLLVCSLACCMHQTFITPLKGNRDSRLFHFCTSPLPKIMKNTAEVM